jgi:hypothetical protein
MRDLLVEAKQAFTAYSFIPHTITLALERVGVDVPSLEINWMAERAQAKIAERSAS